MLEKQVERKLVENANLCGISAYKFTSPNRAAVPDRLMLAPVPVWLRPVIARYVRFVELKRTGAKPTPAQTREHIRLREMGFTVDVVDSVQGGVEVLGEMGDW